MHCYTCSSRQLKDIFHGGKIVSHCHGLKLTNNANSGHTKFTNKLPARGTTTTIELLTDASDQGMYLETMHCNLYASLDLNVDLASPQRTLHEVLLSWRTLMVAVVVLVKILVVCCCRYWTGAIGAGAVAGSGGLVVVVVQVEALVVVVMVVVFLVLVLRC